MSSSQVNSLNIVIKMRDFNHNGIHYILPIALTTALIKPNEYLTLDYGPEYRLEKLIHFDDNNQPIPPELTFIESWDVINVKEWIKDIQTGDMSICGQLIPNLMRLHENILYFLEKDELEFLYNLITPLPPEAVLVELFEFPDGPEAFLSAIQDKYNHYLPKGYQQYNLDVKDMNVEFTTDPRAALNAIRREPQQKYLEGRNKERELYCFPTNTPGR